MTFGERIRALRKEQGMTQEELAQRLSVSRQTVSKWEGDLTQPDLERVIDLGKLFGVTADYLLTGDGEQPGPGGEPRKQQRRKGSGLWKILALAAGLSGLLAFGTMMLTGKADETASAVTVNVNGYGFAALLCLGLAAAALIAMVGRRK